MIFTVFLLVNAGEYSAHMGDRVKHLRRAVDGHQVFFAVPGPEHDGEPMRVDPQGAGVAGRMALALALRCWIGYFVGGVHHYLSAAGVGYLASQPQAGAWSDAGCVRAP